jgi:general stress protein 26
MLSTTTTGWTGVMAAREIDRVWDIIERVGVGMLTTQFPGGLRARPLEARPDRDAGIIWFLTDLRSGKDEEIAAAPDIGLVFIDAGDKAYLSITGRAEIVRDTAKAAHIWKSTDQVWWPGGPEDPTLRLLQVEPRTAEQWDGPASAIVAAFEFAKARLTGTKPNLGENRKVSVPMR